MTAPFGGVVTAINAEVGQTVGSQGVLQLVSTEMEIRVEVDETNLADLELGQPASCLPARFPAPPSRDPSGKSRQRSTRREEP